MLERLFEFIQNFLELFKFWFVVMDYEEAVVMRLGRYKKTLSPGLHFIYPLAIDHVMSENVALETCNLGTQSLITKDGISIAIGVVLSYKIIDVKRFLIETENAASVLEDSTYGVVGAAITASTWDEVHTEDFNERVFKEIHRKALKWGVDIITLQFSDLTKAKCLRLLNEAFIVQQSS